MLLVGFALGFVFVFSFFRAFSLNPVTDGFTREQAELVRFVSVALGVGISVARINMQFKPFVALIVLTVGLVWLVGCTSLSQGWTLAMIGGGIVAMGLLRLRRFLRDHPKVEAVDAR